MKGPGGRRTGNDGTPVPGDMWGPKTADAVPFGRNGG